MMIQTNNRGILVGEHCVTWESIRAVGIRTTADGPFLEDVFWQFLLEDGFIELPGQDVGGPTVGAMQEHLPGMDALKLIAAMGSTGERIWRIWHTKAPGWSEDVLAARFAALMERLGGDPGEAGVRFAALWEGWGDGARVYHDHEHLEECLRELDAASVQAGTADVAELALWYHDAVYVAGETGCEERSAQWLLEDCAAMGIPSRYAAAAAACIRGTDHTQCSEQTAVEALVHDIDLAILATDPLRFMEYEYAVEEEYSQVPGVLYYLARGRFLRELLDREVIFHTMDLRERHEEAARRNITALLSSARYRSHRWFGGMYRILAS